MEGSTLAVAPGAGVVPDDRQGAAGGATGSGSAARRSEDRSRNAPPIRPEHATSSNTLSPATAMTRPRLRPDDGGPGEGYGSNGAAGPNGATAVGCP
ncbi:hypothetical protein V2I01_26735 [Micromonospora sp. BRA006-A]|nr:hypothetical protein [Micromonospora sp. BRA006-A]